MEFTNSITLPIAPDELFDLLLDVERVAPCIPGASVDGCEDDVYRASVKLKVGPITAGYKGTVRFEEVDREQHSALMRASGAEVRGQGKAEAKIRANVSGDETESTLTMETDLAIRGRVAQFGRGVLSEVSQNLMDQFAENLRAQMLDESAPAAPTEGTEAADAGGATAAPSTAAPATASLDLALVVRPLLSRAMPALIGFALGLFIGLRR